MRRTILIVRLKNQSVGIGEIEMSIVCRWMGRMLGLEKIDKSFYIVVTCYKLTITPLQTTV